MAVKLRLRRMGKKRQPIYKLVAADSRAPRNGKFLEAVGLYNPLTDPHTIDLKEDRVLYWLGVGAQPTLTVRSLLSQKGILLKKHLQKKGLSETEIQAKLEEWLKLKEASKSKSGSKKNKKTDTQEKAKEEKAEDIQSAAEVKGATSEEDSGTKE